MPGFPDAAPRRRTRAKAHHRDTFLEITSTWEPLRREDLFVRTRRMFGEPIRAGSAPFEPTLHVCYTDPRASSISTAVFTEQLNPKSPDVPRGSGGVHRAFACSYKTQPFSGCFAMERAGLIGSRTAGRNKEIREWGGEAAPLTNLSFFLVVLSPVRSKRKGWPLWLHPILLLEH